MKPRHFILLLALLQLCVAFLTDAQTFTHEESMWHYIGRNWFRLGLTPYAGGVDNKSPLIFVVFGLSDALFGINYWFPRVLGIAVQSVGMYYLYKTARQLTSPGGTDNRAALLAVTLYGLSLMWRATGGKYASFTETYATTFLIISVYQYIISKNNRQYFLAGILAGCALAWRLSAGFGVTAVLIHSLMKKKQAMLPFIAGIATAATALLLLALAAGISLNDLWLYAFAGNFGAGSTTDHSWSWKLQSFMESFFYSELLLFYPIMAAYFLLNKKYSLLTAWLICEFIGINLLGIYARPHFKSLLPVLSLMGGISIAQLVNDYQLSMRKVLLAVWIIFFPKVTEPLIAVKRIFTGRTGIVQVADSCINYSRPTEQEEKQLGLWIKHNTDKNDKLYVAGFGARVQLYAERLSPTIYFNVTQTKNAIAQTMNEISSGKPAMIAIPAFADYDKYVDEELRRFLKEVVTREYVWERCVNGYLIYRRRV
ncbi:MAG: glycosyltransferase family 39 protein [Chitinophagaceae bacterium]